MPARGEPRRADGLWKHTCFEAFISDANSGGYAEFNCAPSGDWAAYHFASYRSEPLPLVLAQVPISTEIVTGRLRLAAELDLGCLPGGYRRPFALGLAAVLEGADGELGYWALAHPAEFADFHDRRGFLLQLSC